MTGFYKFHIINNIKISHYIKYSPAIVISNEVRNLYITNNLYFM